MLHAPSEILLIDGSPGAPENIVAPLSRCGYRDTHRCDARGGLEEIYRKAPEMILLRRHLPDMDGLHLCAVLKNDILLRRIPVIFLGAGGLLEDEIVAGESGAEDYLGAPLNVDELDGRIRQVFQVGTLGINYHPVTGLPGYNTAYRRLHDVLERKGAFALCFMDILGLGRFNRRFGYEQGDRVLAATARLVSRVLQIRGRSLDFFGHLGSDDFVLVTDEEGVEALCSEIVDQFEGKLPELFSALSPEPDPQSLFASLPVRYGDQQERVFLSMAILTHEGGTSGHVARVIENGMDLLAHAREEPRSRWVRQAPGARIPDSPLSPSGSVVLEESTGLLTGRVQRRPNATLAEHVDLFLEILSKRDLRIFFQPIVHVYSGDLFGYEALLRGPPGTHFESPLILFGMARRLDMETDLDLLCLYRLQEVAGSLRSRGYGKIFVNLCPESFFSPRFQEALDRLAGVLRPETMVLEVTRKRRILDFSGFRASIEAYRKKGFEVAIDDARAGTLSLRTILELVPDYIKLDVSVTRNIHLDLSSQRLFRQFRSFCSRRNVKLVSEGVEQQQERDFLLANGAELAQGFFYAQPQFIPPAAET